MGKFSTLGKVGLLVLVPILGLMALSFGNVGVSFEGRNSPGLFLLIFLVVPGYAVARQVRRKKGEDFWMVPGDGSKESVIDGDALVVSGFILVGAYLILLLLGLIPLPF